MQAGLCFLAVGKFAIKYTVRVLESRKVPPTGIWKFKELRRKMEAIKRTFSRLFGGGGGGGGGANEFMFVFVYIFVASLFFVPRHRRRRRSGREICITCGFRFLGHDEGYLYRIGCLGLIDSFASLLNSLESNGGWLWVTQ